MEISLLFDCLSIPDIVRLYGQIRRQRACFQEKQSFCLVVRRIWGILYLHGHSVLFHSAPLWSAVSLSIHACHFSTLFEICGKHRAVFSSQRLTCYCAYITAFCYCLVSPLWMHLWYNHCFWFHRKTRTVTLHRMMVANVQQQVHMWENQSPVLSSGVGWVWQSYKPVQRVESVRWIRACSCS